MEGLFVVGEAFDDLVFHGLPHLPRPGEELKTEALHRTVGGGVLITATAARRLGTPTRVVATLGENAERHLEREGIVYENLRRPGEEGALTVALSTAGERAFVTFEGANRFVEDRLLARLPPGGARHLHLALSPRRPFDWVEPLKATRDAGTTTSWDFGFCPALAGEREALAALLSVVDVLFVNEAEAKLFAGRDELDAAVLALGGIAKLTIVKRGASGCLWTDGASRGSCPGRAVEAVDTTGAGDAFDGAYLHALLEGLPLDERLRLANEVGARSTLAPGGIDGLPLGSDLA